MAKWVLVFILLFVFDAKAGYFEISASGSYRKSTSDDQTYSIYRSGTGSIAYYFWELSAFELSYTKSRQDDTTKDYSSRAYGTMYGADLIFTLASKQSLFQPYIKVGAAYIDKYGTYKLVSNGSVNDLPHVQGWAPSGGLGFKFILGDHVALKTGFDVWSSPVSEEKTTYDYAAKVGLSFLF